MKPIAVQLYTLRAEAEKDFPGVLRRVADIGYNGVETAGLHGHDPKEIAKLISDLGMVVCSSHTDLPNPDNIGDIVETAQTLGNTRIVSGFGPDDFTTPDSCKEIAARFSLAAELLKPYGMSFGFHNHWWEFRSFEGKYAYDILMAEAPNVFSELDVYWTAFAKADPVKVVAKYKSRIPLLHLKDGTLQEGVPMTAVGSGVVPIPEIVNAADPESLEWLIVELDECASDMFEAVEQSYKYLTSQRLASGIK